MSTIEINRNASTNMECDPASAKYSILTSKIDLEVNAKILDLQEEEPADRSRTRTMSQPGAEPEIVEISVKTFKIDIEDESPGGRSRARTMSQPMSEPSPTFQPKSRVPFLAPLDEIELELPSCQEEDSCGKSQDEKSSDTEPASEPAVMWTMPSSLLCTNFCATRFRKSCYFDATVRWGAKAFAPYNHMLLPIVFTSPLEEYHQLKTNVCLWDVAVERQVQIEGKDAVKLAEMLTPRAMGGMKVGEGRYAICTDNEGKVLNDPLAMRLAEDKFWFSIADSDMLLWAKALSRGLDVKVCEPDVSPLAVQGPKSRELMMDLFGEWVMDLKFFWFREVQEPGGVGTLLEGIDTPLIVARSGWSPELGYEIYLQDSSYGDLLWERIMAAGRKYSITPGVPNQIRRIEAGMLSFGSDMTFDHNILELGMPPKWTGEDPKKVDFMGKEALAKIVEEGGSERRVMGLKFTPAEGEETSLPLPPLMRNWTTTLSAGPSGFLVQPGRSVGEVTSVCFSPTIGANIAIATLNKEAAVEGTVLVVQMPGGQECSAVVQKLPFLQREKYTTSVPTKGV